MVVVVGPQKHRLSQSTLGPQIVDSLVSFLLSFPVSVRLYKSSSSLQIHSPAFPSIDRNEASFSTTKIITTKPRLHLIDVRNEMSEEDFSTSSCGEDVFNVEDEEDDEEKDALSIVKQHLRIGADFSLLFPPDFTDDLMNLLRKNPPQNPSRTYHRLKPRSFDEGRGFYCGELDARRRRHGYGHMVYSCGSRYHGNWMKGVRCGKGTFLWSDSGSVFAGLWKDGERSGFGHFLFGPGRGFSEYVLVSAEWRGSNPVGDVATAYVENGRVVRKWGESTAKEKELVSQNSPFKSAWKKLIKST